MDLILDYVDTIKLVFLGIFLFFIIIGALMGAKRGWKRSTLRIGTIILTIILALFIAPAIYNSAVNDIQLNSFGMEQEGSVGDLLGEMINDNVEGFDVSGLSTIQEFVLKAPSMLVNLFIFIFLFIGFSFITWIIFAILSAILFRGKEKEQKQMGQKPKRGRLIGMAIGALQGFLICAVFLTPVGAISNTANVFVKGIDRTLVSGDMEEMLDGADAIVEFYSKSAPGAVYGALKLDRLFYGYLTTVKVGDYKISLESFADLGAKSVNMGLRWADYMDNNDGFDAESDEAMIALADHTKKFLNEFFEFDLIKMLFNDLGKAISNGSSPINFQELFDDENLGEAVDLTLNGLIGGQGLAKNLKNDLNEVLNLFVSLSNDGTFSMLMNMGEGDTSLTEAQYKSVGKAIDGILELNLLKDSKEYWFNWLGETMLSGFGEEMGVDFNDVKLHELKWELMGTTIYRLFSLMENMDNEEYAGSISDDLVSVIDSLAVQPEESRIETLIEGAVKSLLIGMDLDGVDADYLSDKYLNIFENAKKLGLLIELGMKDDAFDALEPENLSEDDVDSIDSILEVLNHILAENDSGKPDNFVEVMNKLIGGMMGVESVNLNSMANALNAYKLIIKANTIGGAENFTEADSDELIELLMDDGILDMIENHLSEENKVDIDNNKPLITSSIADERTKINTDSTLSETEKAEKLAQLERIEWILGL
ncbi:MAG: hypothetical protein FWD49_07290 [Firmicutes bacterium]|nr:hypothetical protein [Bacillota bacterium]